MVAKPSDSSSAKVRSRWTNARIEYCMDGERIP
jgi:hypothetical protein